MSREKILLIGEPNVSKTKSILMLAAIYPDKQVVVFDPDDGTAKMIEEELKIKDKVEGDNPRLVRYKDIPNLRIYRVIPDWKLLLEDFGKEDSTLKAGAWLCFDMINRLWSMSEEYFSKFVYGEDPIDHLLQFRKMVGRTDFGGFDGTKDWSVIKRLHNEKIVDRAVVNSVYNVMATTGLKDILPQQQKTAPKGKVESIYFEEFGFLPEGEKHNVHRFDTQAYLFRKGNGTYWFRLIRDRGREVNVRTEHEITNKSFWEVYKELRKI